MKKYKWIILLVNLIVLLVFFNYSIIQKEKLLANGQLILLELAPVDPRSLMQGDYMNLRYAISNNINIDSISKRGFCVVKLKEDGVAKKVRIQEQKTPINNDEFLIKYSYNGSRNVHFGAESYFFQEGNSYKFEIAKYGGIKVDDQGNSILIGLFDQNKKRIE
ncbi:GDYXXLXY domain-containing protein [Zunongwangia sp.]|uniref:GDYXXLXY domain-containing protein n=1 Tax=Zunongwangia sp. TaxID=1965325 RepID=UPI003AA7F1A2